MRKLRIVNTTRGTVLLEEAEVAETFFSRLKGLLGRRNLPPGKGMLIKPCRAVHTLGMAFPLDIAFVDGENRICCLIHGLPPYRFSPTVRAAAFVIEAPEGTFARTRTGPGDEVMGEVV